MDDNLTKQLNDFFSQYTPITFTPGDSLITDSTPSGVFYLKAGYVRQYTINGSGNELLINIYKPSTFFPMTWTLCDIPNRHYFEALTNCQLLRASKEQFVAFLDGHPQVLRDLTRRLLVGLDATLERMEHMASGNTYQKVILALAIMARRFGKGQTQNVTPALHLKQETLGSLAGTTKESLSRVLSQLKKNGLITTEDGTITITDLDALEAELAS